ncbi:primosomal replication protein N'' [Yokenella regensburgei]|uniref:primosomal replication protein N'' n=1 Tax=Yokenella regensburgei TaxID=158877 RepID=UPI003F138399
MKSMLLLQALEQKLSALAREMAPLSSHATVSPRFDRQLFRTRSTMMRAYLDEARDNLAALRHAVNAERAPQVAWLAEHLASQLTALVRESAVWSLRSWDAAKPGIAKWQRKRLQHQQFEQRLLAMKREREEKVSQVATFAEQQQLHKEIIAFEERLRRCRHALDKIERVLAHLTR